MIEQHDNDDCEKSYANQNTYCTIDPIHSNSQSFISQFKHQPNKFKQKPAFGTTTVRQIPQLIGNKQSDIVAYSRINYQKNQKYYDRYQQIKAKLPPFMSTSNRFNNNKAKNPGPGNYNFPQIFKNKNQLKKSPKGAMFCPFKRWQNKQNVNQNSNFIKEKEEFNWNSSKNNDRNSFQIQQKIKQKRSQIKQKMQQLKNQFKKPQQNFNQGLKRMGYSENQQRKTQMQQSPRKKLFQERSQQKSLNLRELTSKYLPKKDYDFQKEQYRSGGEIKNFKEKYNNQPSFITKNEDLYSSYINKNESPGPGYYQKKTKKAQRKQSLTFKNYFL